MVKYINQINIVLLVLALALSFYAFSVTFLSPPPEIDISNLPDVEGSAEGALGPTSRTPARRLTTPPTSRPQRSEGRSTQRPSGAVREQGPVPANQRRRVKPSPSRVEDPEEYMPGPGRLTPNPQWIGGKTQPPDTDRRRSSGRPTSRTDAAGREWRPAT